jgi:opacity protein-like surface antigen
LAVEDFCQGDENFRFTDDDLGYKIFGGWRPLAFFAVEAAFVDPGGFNAQEHETVSGDVWFRTTLSAFDAFAVGLIPVGPLEFFGKVGGIAWNSETKIEIENSSEDPINESDSGTDISYGVGVGFRAQKATVRVEYEWFDIGGGDGISMITLGAAYRF